jgi:O-antigen ligase
MVINKGLESFYSHPFVGTGIGSSGIALTGIDQVEFPHNLLVESMIELGIIGGLAYIIIYLYFFIRNLKTVRTDKKLLVLYVMCLLFFLEDMKSGSFDAWRVSLFWMCLYLVQYNFRINYPSKKFIHSV